MSINNKTFDEYFAEVLLNNKELNYNYLGINRKDYPKWQGWKIINSYKKLGFEIKEIDDEELRALVKNFYYVKYLSITINCGVGH